MLRRTVLTAATVGVASAVTGACSSTPKRGPNPPDRVTYVTGLGSFGREGYAWVADAMGFFRAENIVIEKIVPGAAGDFNTKLIAAGQAQFGIIDYSGAVIRAANGQFGGMRCVAAINDKTMIAIMSLVGRGIMVPTDLTHKTVFQAEGSVIRRLWPGYAKLARIDPASVQWRDVAAPSLPAMLASGQAPAIGQFVVGAPAIAEAAGRPLSDVIVLPYSDFMLDLYGNVLITSAQAEPGLVRRFTRALLRGLEYTITNPQDAGALLHKAVATTKAATATAEMQLMKPYVAASSGAAVGAFDRARVARSVALLQTLGLISSTPPMDSFVDFAVAPGR
jgi:NitT/TauT family transport system substrate-binding protein